MSKYYRNHFWATKRGRTFLGTTGASICAMLMAMSVASDAQAYDFEVRDDTKLSLYVEWAPSLKSVTNDSGESEFQYADEGSIVGISGEHQVSEEFTVYGKADFEFLSDDSDPSFSFDEGWVGARGASWGSVQAGGQESPYVGLIADNVNVAEIAEISAGNLPPEDNTVVYQSPTISGFSVASMVRVLGDGDPDAADNQDSTDFDVGGVVSYDHEYFGVAAGYQTVNTRTETVVEGTDIFAVDSSGNPTGDPIGTTGGSTGLTDGETYGVTGDVSYGPGTLAVKASETGGDSFTDTTRVAATGIFRYGQYVSAGAGKVYSSVQLVDPDAGNDRTEVTVGVDFKPMDNLKLYTEAGWFDQRNDAGNVVAAGLILDF